MPHPKKRKKRRSKSSGPTQAKAKEILRHGEVRGKPLTEKQKGFMGARAGGQPVKPAKNKKTAKRPRGKRTARKRTPGKKR